MDLIVIASVYVLAPLMLIVLGGCVVFMIVVMLLAPRS